VINKLILCVFALTLSLVVVSTPALAAIEVEGDAYVGYYDKYLWRGFDLSGGTPVVQGGVDLSAKGFTLSYWTNIQTKDDVVLGNAVNGGDATETDMTLDYTFSPTELLSVSVGTIWYALDGAEDTKEAYLGLALGTILEPSLKVYYDYDQADGNALFYSASISHSVEVNDALSLSFGALVSYNDESDYAVGDYSDWHNYELSTSAEYALTDQISISPSFLFSEGISDEAKDVIDSEMVAGVSLTLTF
jgi:uncharacterized protein (TIGR02001 family)